MHTQHWSRGYWIIARRNLPRGKRRRSGHKSAVSWSLVAFCFALLMAGRWGWAAPAGSVGSLIQAAGEAEDEHQRYTLLRLLEQRGDLAPGLLADLGKLMPVVDAWANGKDHPVNDTSRAAENGYLCRFIRVRAEGEGAMYPPAIAKGSPLRPIWAMYRGRMLIWQVIQSGPLLGVKERRDKYFGEARNLLREAEEAFPKNRVVGMYLGKPIPWSELFAAHPDAPDWANLQREGLEKLGAIIHWWIDERQLADGQFGGGWGDDVEMWRWWAPVLIGFEDPKVAAAQERLSRGMFQQPHMKEGFTKRMTDVEHSNEDTTDTIQPMMHLRPEDPLWKQRALRLAELMRERWTGTNQRGQLQFKSIYFSVDKVDPSSERAFDTVYHPCVVQPALLYWQRTGDPALGRLFGDWLKVWVEGTARTGNGKPAGIMPPAIHWPDGGIGVAGRPWWEPFSPGHNDRLYNWPGAARLMTSTMLLAWQMSGDKRYLEPIESMALFEREHRGKSDVPGEDGWIAARLASFLPDTLAKYRFLSGDTKWDDLLHRNASGYAQFRLGGDKKSLVNALRRNAEAFRSNWEAYTSEMRWTDRVLSFTRNFLQYLPEKAPPAPSPETLYSSLTGDPGNPLVFPLNAVRWLTPPKEIAALVTASSRQEFAAELFHFGAGPRKMGAELYLLEPGRYRLSLREAGSLVLVGEQALEVKKTGTIVRFELPSGTVCTLQVRKNQRGK